MTVAMLRFPLTQTLSIEKPLFSVSERGAFETCRLNREFRQPGRTVKRPLTPMK
jgi:hypothetical protein